MSYDFQLFRVPVGVDPMSAYEMHLGQQRARAASRHRGEDYWGSVDPLKEKMKRQLSATLIRSHPELQLSERNYVELARIKSINEDEARRRYRDLELSDLELGLQVLLFDDTAYVTLSFDPENRAKAETRLQTAWGCLMVLEREGSFSTYDSQAGKILHLDSDFEAVLQRYLSASHKVDAALRSQPM